MLLDLVRSKCPFGARQRFGPCCLSWPPLCLDFGLFFPSASALRHSLRPLSSRVVSSVVCTGHRPPSSVPLAVANGCLSLLLARPPSVSAPLLSLWPSSIHVPPLPTPPALSSSFSPSSLPCPMSPWVRGGVLRRSVVSPPFRKRFPSAGAVFHCCGSIAGFLGLKLCLVERGH